MAVIPFRLAIVHKSSPQQHKGAFSPCQGRSKCQASFQTWHTRAKTACLCSCLSSPVPSPLVFLCSNPYQELWNRAFLRRQKKLWQQTCSKAGMATLESIDVLCSVAEEANIAEDALASCLQSCRISSVVIHAWMSLWPDKALSRHAGSSLLLELAPSRLSQDICI